MFGGNHTIIDPIGKNTHFNFSDKTGTSSKILLQVINKLIIRNSTFGSSSRFLPVKKMHY